jgi:hypothetical protein
MILRLAGEEGGKEKERQKEDKDIIFKFLLSLVECNVYIYKHKGTCEGIVGAVLPIHNS